MQMAGLFGMPISRRGHELPMSALADEYGPVNARSALVARWEEKRQVAVR
jgi:hypothetical protein